MWHDTPVFISISELVLRALVLDQKRHGAKGSVGLDNADVGLILCSVIIRFLTNQVMKFVNYVNEVCQPVLHKISIRNAVGKMDIPNWIVNLRHQATHGQIPPMSMLKEAIKFCRKWLWFQHWSKPLTDAIKQTLPGEYEEHIQLLQSHLNNRMCNALQRFREWRRLNPTLTEFPSANSNSPSTSSSTSPNNVSIRNSFESLLDSHEESFIPFFALTCLAQNSADDDKSSISSDLAESEDDIFVADSLDEGEFLQGNLFSQQKHIGIISAEEQCCYSPIFHLMSSKGLLHCLLLEITRLVSNECFLPTFGRRKHLAGWAEILLCAYLKTPTSISFQDWRTILRHFVMAPQFFQDEQIKSLLSILNDGLSKKCKARLLKLFNIREQTGVKEEPNTTLIDQSTIYSIKTLGDLQSQIVQNEQNLDCTFICDPLTMEDDWSLSSANELGPSLGLTCDQTADTLCLALESNFF
uniref:Uncharacterized protein n=1 Tax=Meloidogyne incognita TaxID=6306 RepID=A0A914KHN0_MELIC